MFDVVTSHEIMCQTVAFVIPLNASTKEILAHRPKKTTLVPTEKLLLNPARTKLLSTRIEEQFWSSGKTIRRVAKMF